MTVHLVIPDAHAHPDYDNKRFDYLAQFIKDLKPDVVINLGDGADMPSLSSYDKGTKGFAGRTYRRDIDAFLESQERTWGPVKRTKKKMPRSVYLEGNHEYRIKRAVNFSPELEGTYGLHDLELDKYYNDVVEYNGATPGVIRIDGVCYSHYFISGVMGRPISGEHPAYSLITKEFVSCTQGHAHVFDYAMRTDAVGNKIMGLVAGCYQDYISDYAGEANHMWEAGVAVKRNVEQGRYDLQWISLAALKKEYS